MSVIDKPCIFITSTGRTGTQFFGQKMSRMIDGCTSIHEADLVWLRRPREWYGKLRRFGLCRMTVGRLTPYHSLRTLANARQTNRISDSEAVDCLKALRLEVIRTCQRRVFCEANAQYGAVVDLLEHAFPNSRTLYVVRDPRDWVRSFMNIRAGFYSPFEIRRWIPKGRLKASQFASDPYANQWRKMSRFERLCWAWNQENSHAIRCAAKTDNARVCRFEDLFHGQQREEAFRKMLEFVTEFPDGFRARWTFDPSILSQKVHSKSAGPFPKWTEWQQMYVNQVHEHCGELMQQFGYGQEPQWREKVSCD